MQFYEMKLLALGIVVLALLTTCNLLKIFNFVLIDVLLPYTPDQMTISVIHNAEYYIPLLFKPFVGDRCSITKDVIFHSIFKSGIVLLNNIAADIAIHCAEPIYNINIKTHDISSTNKNFHFTNVELDDIDMRGAKLLIIPNQGNGMYMSKKECVMTIRHPFQRAVSLFLYVRLGKENQFKDSYLKLNEMDLEEGVSWLFHTWGIGAMQRSHEQTMENLRQCKNVFTLESFKTDFDTNVNSILDIVGISNSSHTKREALFDSIKQHDINVVGNSHTTYDKTSSDVKKRVIDVMMKDDKIMEMLNSQINDLGDYYT